MSRKLGAFDPASTASTTVITLTTTARGIVEAVAQNFFPFESTAANLASGDGVFTSVGAFSYSSAVGTPYGAGTALRVESGAHMTITSAGAVQMMEFSSAFTFEFWAHRDSNSGNQQILDSRSDDANPGGCLLIQFTDGNLRLTNGGSGGGFIDNRTSTVADAGQWQHYAISRDSSDTLKMFIDGAVVLTTTLALAFDNKANGGAPHFFETVNNGFGFTGYIRDLRIFKDVCIYTTAFPVTTIPLRATSDNVAITGSSTTVNTRSHSHVWNYSDVYDARFADTWPTENASIQNVTIKAWGAGGGGGYWNGGSAGNGGAGGFAQGTSSAASGATLLFGQSVYVVVGTGGLTVSTNNAGSKTAAEGGNGSANKYANHRGGSGGGFSGVFTGNSGSDVTQANALVIAGGGGGGSSYDRSGADESGGGGGGTNGSNGKGRSPGSGGSQSAGGTSSDGGAGAALKGGNVATSEATNMAAGGGGGGYFGGGAGSVTGSSDAENTGGGGGGSGFVKTGFQSTSLLTGNQGTAGSTTGKVTAIASAASADANYSTGVGLGGGFNSTGGNGYVVIIDGAGTNVFTASQSYTIR